MRFTMWSWFHIIYLISPFIFFLILFLLTKNKSTKQKRPYGIVLSIVAVVLLFLRNLEIYLENGLDAEIIPLQICHFANFIMLFAFIFNNKTLFALSFCLNLPAAFTSIVFANSLENYNTLLTFRGMAYLWGHLLIVSIVLWSYFIGFVKIDKKTFLKTVITMAVLYLSAHLINNLLRLTGLTPNYFYTIIPEDGTPLEWFYNLGQDYQLGSFVINPIYLLMSMFFGLVVVIIFYFIYKVLLPLTALKNEKKLLS